VTARPDGIVALGGGRFAIVDGSSRRIAYAAADGAQTWVFLEGQTFVLSEARPGRRHAGEDEHVALTAPMPATVASIAVSAGTRVSKGDVLLTLEAMKMELPIRAHRDGTVTRIACRVGDLVQPGVALADLE
jgi:biotin carboxyl carrier protein